jgi:hypothetical protein
MKTVISALIDKVTYLNVILTVIAALLAIQTVRDLGLIGPKAAHAAGPAPVHIESVAGNLPVVIKAPVSYNGNVCAGPCR